MQVTTNAASSERTQIANLKQYPRRVLLRRWGFSVDEAAGLLPDLPSLEGRLEWTLDDREKPRPDLVVHLVDATRLSGVCAGARWNAMGPVEAMRKARRRGTSEIAIVLGSVQHLPAERTGCWILAGSAAWPQPLPSLREPRSSRCSRRVRDAAPGSTNWLR
ncbi:hypothetical protein ACU4HD_22275 [Cupriavidus basilensis]